MQTPLPTATKKIKSHLNQAIREKNESKIDFYLDRLTQILKRYERPNNPYQGIAKDELRDYSTISRRDRVGKFYRF